MEHVLVSKSSLRFLCAALVASGFLGCSTNPSSERSARWKTMAASPEFQKEKQTYRERIGADFCWTTGVSSFLVDESLKPSKTCLYPASKMIVEREYDSIVFKGENILKQAVNELKVLQVTPEGFVVQTPHVITTTIMRGGRSYTTQRAINTLIFIHKTDEAGLVDGQFLDESHAWNLYEYVGPFSYQTVAGSRTVHSFRKVARDRFAKAREGLTTYEPQREFFIVNQLWDRLEVAPK